MPYSGQPVSGCSSSTPHTWRYDQILRNTGGSAITLTRRANYFDGTKVSEPTFELTIQPGASHTQATSWCSANNTQHTARTDWFAGTTTIQGPTVTLQPR